MDRRVEEKVIGSANVGTSVTMTVIVVAIFARSSTQKKGGTPESRDSTKALDGKWRP